MLDLSFRGIIKTVCNPANIYDGIVLGLNYMPTKPVAVATSAMASMAALYLIEPESFFYKASIVTISSGLAWASVETAHRIACKLWQKRCGEIQAIIKEYEKRPEVIEANRKANEDTRKLIDELLNDPKFLEEIGLNHN